MLIAIPKQWFSWKFTVTDGSQPVAEIDISQWREKGRLTVEGVDYRVYRENMMSGDFILESAGSVVARAQKPSAFHRTFEISHDGDHYTLQAESAFRRTFLLLSGERQIGSLSPERMMSRRAAVDLPAELPLAVRVFVIWLALILWKRAADAGAAA
jgi:hypothetical protein